jgi:hypothetical protein
MGKFSATDPTRIMRTALIGLPFAGDYRRAEEARPPPHFLPRNAHPLRGDAQHSEGLYANVSPSHGKQDSNHIAIMKSSKSTCACLASLSLALMMAFAFTGCKSTRSGSTGGYHNMGGPKPAYPMSNEAMSGQR